MAHRRHIERRAFRRFADGVERRGPDYDEWACLRMPSALEEAFGFCEDLLGQPHCQVVEPGERHWDIFKRLCIETDTRGSRVTAAWFAALAIEWGCEWITLDRDYARFPKLKWQVPIAD